MPNPSQEKDETTWHLHKNLDRTGDGRVDIADLRFIADRDSDGSISATELAISSVIVLLILLVFALFGILAFWLGSKFKEDDANDPVMLPHPANQPPVLAPQQDDASPNPDVPAAVVAPANAESGADSPEQRWIETQARVCDLNETKRNVLDLQGPSQQRTAARYKKWKDCHQEATKIVNNSCHSLNEWVKQREAYLKDTVVKRREEWDLKVILYPRALNSVVEIKMNQ